MHLLFPCLKSIPPRFLSTQDTSKHSVPRKASAASVQLETVEHAMRSSRSSATRAVEAPGPPTTPAADLNHNNYFPHGKTWKNVGKLGKCTKKNIYIFELFEFYETLSKRIPKLPDILISCPVSLANGTQFWAKNYACYRTDIDGFPGVAHGSVWIGKSIQVCTEFVVGALTS